MKKRGMTLFALFALVAITSYLVSGTYAKYTYNFDTSDSARVAKWGVNKSFTVDLFKDSYIDETNAVTDVDSNDGDKVVAPGTAGLYAFDLDLTDDNTPETNYKIMFTNITDDKTTESGTILKTQDNVGQGKITYYLMSADGLTINANTKFKDVFTDAAIADTNTNSTTNINELVQFIQNKYNNNVYAANTVDEHKWVIGWKWDFEESDAENLTDTTLGDNAVANDIMVALSLNIKIEQSELAPVESRS